MTPAFAARLEQEVGDGFPTKAQTADPRRPRRWVLVPAGGLLAAMALALVAVIGPSGSDEPAAERTALNAQTEPAIVDEAAKPSAIKPAAPPPQFDDEGGGGSVSSAPSAAEAAKSRNAATLSRRKPESFQRQTAPPPPPPPPAQTQSSGGATKPSAASAPSVSALDRSANPKVERKAERNALLVLETPNAKLESTSDNVIRTVDRFGGIVQSSSIGSRDGSGGESTFVLRIPTERLDQALAALSKLGHVAERTQNLQDITGSFTSAQDRLSDARAERRGLLRALGRATTPLQIETLRTRLRLVRSTIARLNGELNSLRRRADLSTVQLTVRGTGKAEEGTGGGGTWTPGDAANDAVRVLEVIAGVALIALAVAAPLALLGLAIMLGVRIGRRRRREGALDAA